MARRRVYIAPFLADGTGYDNFIEVTQDVDFSNLGTVNYTLDVSDYDIGVFTNSGLGLNLVNAKGLYSDVSNDNSIFQLKRGDSLIKITWDLSDFDFFPGISLPGEIAGGEVQVYLGLLNDDSTVFQLNGQEINFNILGLESILDRSNAPDWTLTPPEDNKVSTLVKALLAQANASTTVSVLTIDNSMITPGNDITWDDLSVFQNQTCRDVMNSLLTAANSVMFLRGTTPIVSGRVPTSTVKYKFYGQGSVLGPENLADIQDIRTGLNRTFNFLTFANDNTLSSQDLTSISKYGVRSKSISVDGITTVPTIQSILNGIRTEFANPKQEFTLIAPLTPGILQLNLLDLISIDYPLVPIDTDLLPIYGVAVYERDSFAANLSSFTISPNDGYKVIGLQFDLAQNQATFNLRLI